MNRVFHTVVDGRLFFIKNTAVFKFLSDYHREKAAKFDYKDGTVDG